MMAFFSILRTCLICCLFVATVVPSPIVERKVSEMIDSDPGQQVEKKAKSLTISIQRPGPIHEEFNDSLTDDEAAVLLPKALKRRMGRFLFDFLDTSESDTDSHGGYMSQGSDDIFSGLGRLFNLNLDSNAVMTGVLAPENIAIHVAQNGVNFIASSMAWLALGALTSRTHISRQASDTPTYEVPADYTAYGTTALPSYPSAASSKHRSSDGDSADKLFLSKKDTLKSTPKNVVYVSNNSEQEMYNDVSQEELERERLYKLQVQEYRRRKKLEQLRSQTYQGAASEQVEVVADSLKDAIPYRLHPTPTPEEQAQHKSNQDELDKRLMKIESYKTYLERQQQKASNQLSPKNQPMATYNERVLVNQDVHPNVLVKKKGPFVSTKGGNVVRRVRKILKKPSSSN